MYSPKVSKSNLYSFEVLQLFKAYPACLNLAMLRLTNN